MSSHVQTERATIDELWRWCERKARACLISREKVEGRIATAARPDIHMLLRVMEGWDEDYARFRMLMGVLEAWSGKARMAALDHAADEERNRP